MPARRQLSSHMARGAIQFSRHPARVIHDGVLPGDHDIEVKDAIGRGVFHQRFSQHLNLVAPFQGQVIRGDEVLGFGVVQHASRKSDGRPGRHEALPDIVFDQPVPHSHAGDRLEGVEERARAIDRPRLGIHDVILGRG